MQWLWEKIQSCVDLPEDKSSVKESGDAGSNPAPDKSFFHNKNLDYICNPSAIRRTFGDVGSNPASDNYFFRDLYVLSTNMFAF